MLLIKNGNVYTMESDKSERLDVLINDDGKITKVAFNINVDRETIDITKMPAYNMKLEAFSKSFPHNSSSSHSCFNFALNKYVK